MTEVVENAVSTDEIRVFGLDEPNELAPFIKRADARYARRGIPVEKLSEQFSDFVAKMRDVVGTVPEHLGDFQVQEISFTAQVSAKGSVNLLGTGGEIAGGGGIAIKLVRTGVTAGPVDDAAPPALPA